VHLINVGFGNMISSSKIVAVVSPDSAPVKRIVQEAKEIGKAIDASQGRKTKSVIIMDSNHVVLSALTTDIVANRINNDNEGDLNE
jgi:extracellular matrix regulatory protein A